MPMRSVARAFTCCRASFLPTRTKGSGRSADRRSLRNLRAACTTADARGVTLLVEALNPHDVPDYFFSTQADAHAIRDDVGAANLKVQMDFYHTEIVEGDIATKLERWLPHIGHIQIAGVPGRHEPDVRHAQLRGPPATCATSSATTDGWAASTGRCGTPPRALPGASDWWFRCRRIRVEPAGFDADPLPPPRFGASLDAPTPR